MRLLFQSGDGAGSAAIVHAVSGSAAIVEPSDTASASGSVNQQDITTLSGDDITTLSGQPIQTL